MVHVRTYRLPHYEQYPVHVALFRDVSNAAFLRKQLLEANEDFDYAFLDASMIISLTHLLSASFMAVHRSLTNSLKARTPHSELVFRLHPNNNIGESYRKFGISDTTTALIAVKLSLSQDITAETVAAHLGEAVQGESVQIGDDGHELTNWTDANKVNETYKTPNLLGKNGHASDNTNLEHAQAVILGLMTIKGS
ncbi:CGI-121-domain-containing protein [Westerdykella ornata]|uniref:EKC/KEOPS complex subunit CGI121 n=1 Tax=Westerdykella ornata TaxID=318751 RepID=A0A6A6JA56_WESOR|nr:CGI-121-domain-containing protein [Westerdykella ornata]KAF2273114.1 CGI-121-domain-containing protein [Westerdykella ornata]